MIDYVDTLDIAEAFILVPMLYASPNSRLGVSISQYVCEQQAELRIRGEQLDRRYASLLERERCLVNKLECIMNDPYRAAIEADLDLIRYEMTQILDEFDQDGCGEFDNDVFA